MDSKKPTLSIHESQYRHYGTLGMHYLLNSLKDSDLFNITYHKDFVKCCRDYRATILYYNGYKIYLDFWEYPTPTYTGKVLKENFDLIIKLQHRDMSLDYFNKTSQKRGFMVDSPKEEKKEFLDKIIPWTFFPSKMMKPFIGKEKHLQKNNSNEIFGFFCGKGWKCRKHIKKHLINNNIEYIVSDQESEKKLTDEDFLNKMQSSKFGIVIQGRARWCTDSKNRREIDYMMMKKPLLMSYSPFYYNPLNHGEHFILFDNKTDLNSLEDLYNINEIAENGHRWYLENATPMGISKTFLNIMKDRFNE
jgi:hypothetical protein